MDSSATAGSLRPPAPDDLVLAFDIGGTTVKAAAIDADLRVHASVAVPTREGPAIVDAITAAETALRSELGAAPATIRATGVIMPGLVDTEEGIVRRAVNLNLRDFPIAAALADAFALPVGLGHDVAAAAEAVVVSEPELVDPFVVVLGTGVAAVSYLVGQAWRGTSGQAGEFGHMVARPGGRDCRCGNRGCVEAYAGAYGMLHNYLELGGRAQIRSVRDLVQHSADDEIAAQVWQTTLEVLADGLLTVCALTAPGSIVLAGGVSEAGEALRAGVEAQMRDRAIVPTVPPVHTSALGGRAGLVGAGLIGWRAAQGADR